MSTDPQTAAALTPRIICGLAVLSLIACLGTNPQVTPVPNVDVSVFMYMGNILLDGRLPYRDAFDHKGPGLYYVNAIAMGIGGRSIWSIWILECVAVVFASLASYLAIGRPFGKSVALFGTCSWMLSLTFLRMGNRPEELVIPVLFSTVLLGARVLAEETLHRTCDLVLIGALTGLAISMKITMIGAFCAFTFLLIVTHIRSGHLRRLVLSLVWICVGVVIVLGPMILHYGLQGGLDDMYRAIFQFGRAYAGVSIRIRITQVGEGLRLLATSGLLLLGIAGWLSAVLVRPQVHISPLARATVGIAAIDLPLTALLISLPGRTFPYYYIVMLPSLSILASWLMLSIVSQIRSQQVSVRPTSKSVSASQVLIVLILLAQLPVPFNHLSAQLSEGIGRPATTAELAVNFVESNTEPGDTVYLWGNETWLYVGSNRSSPTDLIYVQPLITPGFTTPDTWTAFMTDLVESPPRLILDGGRNNYWVPPLDPLDRQTWMLRNEHDLVYDIPDEAEDLYRFVAEHYTLVARIGDEEWAVYKLNDG